MRLPLTLDRHARTFSKPIRSRHIPLVRTIAAAIALLVVVLLRHAVHRRHLSPAARPPPSAAAITLLTFCPPRDGCHAAVALLANASQPHLAAMPAILVAPQLSQRPPPSPPPSARGRGRRAAAVTVLSVAKPLTPCAALSVAATLARTPWLLIVTTPHVPSRALALLPRSVPSRPSAPSARAVAWATSCNPHTLSDEPPSPFAVLLPATVFASAFARPDVRVDDRHACVVDLRRRLRRASAVRMRSLSRREFRPMFAQRRRTRAAAYADAVRTAAADGAIRNVLLNSSERPVPSWLSEVPITTSQSASLVRAHAFAPPLSSVGLTPLTPDVHAYTNAARRFAHDVLSLPWDILHCLPVHGLRAVLDVISMNEADRGIIVLRPMHGLGNRLRAMASTLAFASATSRTAIILWRRDLHCGAAFEDLFDIDNTTAGRRTADDTVPAAPSLPYVVVDVEEEPFFPAHRTGPHTEGAYARRDSAWRGWRVYDYGNGTSTPALDAQPWQHMLVRSPSTLSTPRNARATSWRRTNDQLHLLTRRAARPVQREVRRLKPRLRQSVCVHVRHTALRDDVPGVSLSDAALAYGGRLPCGIAEWWRNASTPAIFARAALRALRENPALTGGVFIAADAAKWRHAVARHASERKVTAWSAWDGRQMQECDGRGVECVQRALVDMLSLAECAVVLGSYWSSFSEVVSRLRGRKVEMAGVDFDAVDMANVDDRVTAEVRDHVVTVLARRTNKKARI